MNPNESLPPTNEPPKSPLSDYTSSGLGDNAPKKRKLGLAIVIILIIVILGVGGYFAYTYWQSQQSNTSSQDKPGNGDKTADVNPPATNDPTANWKSLNDSSAKTGGKTLSFKYPDDWILTTPTAPFGPGKSVTIASPDSKIAVNYYNGTTDSVSGDKDGLTFAIINSSQLELTTASDKYVVGQYLYSKTNTANGNATSYTLIAYITPKPMSTDASTMPAITPPLNKYYQGADNSSKTNQFFYFEITPLTSLTQSDLTTIQASDNFKIALQILQSFAIK